MTCKDCNHHRTDGTCANNRADYFGLKTEDGCLWHEADWISTADELPQFGETVVTYRPETNGKKVNTERYLYGEWTGWAPYRGPVTHWLRLPELPED